MVFYHILMCQNYLVCKSETFTGPFLHGYWRSWHCRGFNAEVCVYTVCHVAKYNVLLPINKSVFNGLTITG